MRTSYMRKTIFTIQAVEDKKISRKAHAPNKNVPSLRCKYTTRGHPIYSARGQKFDSEAVCSFLPLGATGAHTSPRSAAIVPASCETGVPLQLTPPRPTPQSLPPARLANPSFCFPLVKPSLNEHRSGGVDRPVLP